MPDIYLSVIIPVYNEERRLPHTLEQVFAFLLAQSYASEVIVIDNGSQDNTLTIANEQAKNHPLLTVMHTPEKGKGNAVKQGMLAACGEYRFMCDADLSMPASEINRFLPPAIDDYDIAIASREAPGAIRYNEPQYRHLVGRIFNGLIRLVALPGLHDTQCGFKCFRAGVVEEIFPIQTIQGWAFDVELLFIARQRGYRIVELPIAWYFNPESKISVLKDAGRMALDLFKIRLNALRGVYDK